MTPAPQPQPRPLSREEIWRRLRWPVWALVVVLAAYLLHSLAELQGPSTGRLRPAGQVLRRADLGAAGGTAPLSDPQPSRPPVPVQPQPVVPPPAPAPTAREEAVPPPPSPVERPEQAAAGQPVAPPEADQPVPPAPRTEMEVAAWQVALERLRFSAGTIDGVLGSRSRKSIAHFQRSRDLPVTGLLDEATRRLLGEPREPFAPYAVTEEDMALVAPTPGTWREKSAARLLGYADSWAMLAEKAHSTPQFLASLNPGREAPVAGDTVLLPDLAPALPLPPAGRIRILLSETTLLVLDAADAVVACFPCSIAADKDKVPSGALEIAVLAPNPNYTFNPALFPADAQAEGITSRLVIPPGPRNPVGLAWIGLSQPGYGIHGTPDASSVSRTGSHGCFRLANWNAVLLLKCVRKGVPVEVLP